MTRETIPGTKAIAERIVNAEINFVKTLMELGGISKEDAVKASATLRKAKATKLDAIIGRITVIHGAYLDRDVIRRASAM